MFSTISLQHDVLLPYNMATRFAILLDKPSLHTRWPTYVDRNTVTESNILFLNFTHELAPLYSSAINFLAFAPNLARHGRRLFLLLILQRILLITAKRALPGGIAATKA